jgi:hypothetical protein
VFLAEKMTNMNKQRQVELRGFLTWLERATGTEVAGLAGKSNVIAYQEHDIGALPSILRRNRKRLKVSPDSRSFQEELDRELNASKAKLMPLTVRIVATDRLIDQIIYKLYGLTEDEIAIVEGRT